MTPLAVAGALCVGLGVATWGPKLRRAEVRLGSPPALGLHERLRPLLTSSTRWLRVTGACAVVAVLLVIGRTAVVPFAVLLASGLVWRRRRSAARTLRVLQKQDRDDVQALRALAAELRSGLPPPDALRAAAGHAALAGLRKRMHDAAVADKLGGDPAQVLGEGAEPGSAAGGVAAAWAVCQVTGASLAAPVTRIADAAASALLLAREADAALASARSSARLLAVLPVAGVALGSLSGTGALRVLVATGPGQLCLLAGVTLEFAGLAWLDRLAGAAA
jgi:tight adherence protein B